MDEKAFVVILALPMDTDDSWIMVKNKSRGWEFPGGHLETGELPEEAGEPRFVECFRRFHRGSRLVSSNS